MRGWHRRPTYRILTKKLIHTVTHLVLIIGAWNIDLGSFCGPQARQRKGKVPNNPPEIDVDLPVGALYVEI